ncbi:MAG TPA: hypothetical protein VL172_10505 [Kofleriaceae bacterium]|nr:hypothetical protein [Kofleriaceae bacterium]
MGAKLASADHDEAHETSKKHPAEGSIFVPREAEDAATDIAGAAGKFKFQMLADREARWNESRFWKEFRIGHSWIRLIDPAGAVDSWGYWPDLWGGHAVDPKHPWKSVPGKVLHPDTEHAPNAIKTYEIDAKQAGKLTKAANDKEASPGSYNLFTYNCTTFVQDMARHAGVPVPSASTLGVANPNDLFQAIEKLNRNDGLDAMGNALPSGDQAPPGN